MLESVQTQPCRPSSWVFGETGGAQVWAAHGHRALLCTVLISDGAPIIMVNQAIMGTPSEMTALSWAFEQIAARERGFFVRLV